MIFNVIKYKYRKAFWSNPVVILGMPKSGTSAIASLLGKLSGEKYLVDHSSFWYPNNYLLINRKANLETHFINNSEILKNRIIKEPNFTLLFEQIHNLFPFCKFIYIVRNPEDNIRSILDRMDVKGDLENLDNLDKIDSNWKPIFKKGFYSSKEQYIDILAEMWVKFTDVYIANSSKMILCKYEDFLIDKNKEIKRLAEASNLKQKNDILNFLNYQYQPKGKSNIDIENFYGNNLLRINNICGINKNFFQYI